MPTIGIILSLLSYGGSSLLSSSLALGIMLSFSRN
ncbi:MAG: FtsW/RodA/SpoVE family cell cycle protein [Wolbachia sp.]